MIFSGEDFELPTKGQFDSTGFAIGRKSQDRSDGLKGGFSKSSGAILACAVSYIDRTDGFMDAISRASALKVTIFLATFAAFFS